MSLFMQNNLAAILVLVINLLIIRELVVMARRLLPVTAQGHRAEKQDLETLAYIIAFGAVLERTCHKHARILSTLAPGSELMQIKADAFVAEFVARFHAGTDELIKLPPESAASFKRSGDLTRIKKALEFVQRIDALRMGFGRDLQRLPAMSFASHERVLQFTRDIDTEFALFKAAVT